MSMLWSSTSAAARMNKKIAGWHRVMTCWTYDMRLLLRHGLARARVEASKIDNTHKKRTLAGRINQNYKITAILKRKTRKKPSPRQKLAHIAEPVPLFLDRLCPASVGQFSDG
jgi:hypothetical protein